MGDPEITAAAGPVGDDDEATADPPALGTPECPCHTEGHEAVMVTIRTDEDGAPTVWADPCIAPLVAVLNDAGMPTVASCCGHGENPGVVSLADGRHLWIGADIRDGGPDGGALIPWGPLPTNDETTPVPVEGDDEPTAGRWERGEDGDPIYVRAEPFIDRWGEEWPFLEWDDFNTNAENVPYSLWVEAKHAIPGALASSGSGPALGLSYDDLKLAARALDPYVHQSPMFDSDVSARLHAAADLVEGTS